MTLVLSLRPLARTYLTGLAPWLSVFNKEEKQVASCGCSQNLGSVRSVSNGFPAHQSQGSWRGDQ